MRLAAEGVEYPWLCGLLLHLHTQHVVYCVDTVQNEWLVQQLAETYLLAKYLYLSGIGCRAQAVEPAFADGQRLGQSCFGWELRMPRMGTPRVDAILDNCLAFAGRMVCVEIDGGLWGLFRHGTGSYPLPPQG